MFTDKDGIHADHVVEHRDFLQDCRSTAAMLSPSMTVTIWFSFMPYTLTSASAPDRADQFSPRRS